MPTQAEKVEFLKKVRTAIDNNQFDFRLRDKNLNSMRKYGYKTLDVKLNIKSLTPTFFIETRLDDNPNFEPENVWIFKRILYGAMFYIKIRFKEQGEKGPLVVISFHEDEK